MIKTYFFWKSIESGGISEGGKLSELLLPLDFSTLVQCKSCKIAVPGPKTAE